MQTIKGNYKYRSGSVKYRLNFTKAENKSRYLTDLTDNITF